MRPAFLVLTALIVGCSKAPQPVPSWKDWAQLTILDRVLTKADYSNAIVQAERDLPGDEWREKPWRHNVSRTQREYSVGGRMLAEIKPGLKAMSVTELISSLKVAPYPEGALTNKYEGVAAYVYMNGNEAIIGEIKSRPTNELQVLRTLAIPKVEVYEGPQGGMTVLDEIIKYDILGEK
jgi:hypothetical protein